MVRHRLDCEDGLNGASRRAGRDSWLGRALAATFVWGCLLATPVAGVTSTLEEQAARYSYFAWVELADGYRSAFVPASSTLEVLEEDGLLVAPIAHAFEDEAGEPHSLDAFDLMRVVVAPGYARGPYCDGESVRRVDRLRLQHYQRGTISIGGPFRIARFDSEFRRVTENVVEFLGNAGPWILVRECWTQDQCDGARHAWCGFVAYNVDTRQRLGAPDLVPGASALLARLAEIAGRWNDHAMVALPTLPDTVVSADLDFVDGRAVTRLHLADVDESACSWPRCPEDASELYWARAPLVAFEHQFGAAPWQAYELAPEVVRQWWDGVDGEVLRRGWSDPVPVGLRGTP